MAIYIRKKKPKFLVAQKKKQKLVQLFFNPQILFIKAAHHPNNFFHKLCLSICSIVAGVGHFCNSWLYIRKKINFSGCSKKKIPFAACWQHSSWSSLYIHTGYKFMVRGRQNYALLWHFIAFFVFFLFVNPLPNVFAGVMG